MNMNEAGYREIEHTADWALEVWAPDYPALLTQAVNGMYELSGARFAASKTGTQTIEVDGIDRESRLVHFLTELLYLGEEKEIGCFVEEILEINEILTARVLIHPIISQEKEIKAVTFHNLEIVSTDEGMQVTIVFDV